VREYGRTELGQLRTNDLAVHHLYAAALDQALGKRNPSEAIL
jgi:hypothetical protein